MRNRIKGHRQVKAGELLRNEHNPRTHSEVQQKALAAIYEEIGFARSLLAYELPDGRLKLIDGHMRADMTPEELVEVEVLDVSDAEARALLLAIDPLAQLAGFDEEALEKLRSKSEQESAAIKTLWATLREQEHKMRGELRRKEKAEEMEKRFFVLIACENETQQLALLQRFQLEGLSAEAKLG